MGIAFAIELLVSVLRGFLLTPKKAAPYAKWLLRIRDYLLLLFPTDMYPVHALGDTAVKALPVGHDGTVPVESVKQSGITQGFNIPFIKGM